MTRSAAPLSPEMAAMLADSVYGIRETANAARGVSARMRSAAGQIGSEWDIAGGVVVNGISGGLTVVKESGFALVLSGLGARSGETAVLTRGTQTKADWISNLNIASTHGPGGLLVHAGFASIYGTLVDQIAAALPPRGRIHLVGHSLGGALANLLAARLSDNPAFSPEVYTFGAPRVGPAQFCSVLERRLGAEAIHRVYDVADPVPMIPVFPYLHSPLTRDGTRVGNSAGLIDVSKHDISANYTRLVAGKQWGQLSRDAAEIRNFRQLDELLDIAGLHVRIPGGSMGLWALNKALQAIIDVSYLVLGVAIGVVDTVIDKLSALLIRAAQLVRELGEKIVRFMTMVFKWAGKAIGSAIDVTSAFLRYSIELLLRPISAMARLALEKL